MPAGPNAGLIAATAPLDGAELRAPTGDPGPQGELLDLDGPEGAEGPVTALREVRARGRGRPPGSPNRRTEDLRRFILARFKHPVVALAEIYSLPATELAAALDCKPLDALTLQIRAAAEAAPYVDSKMPVRLSVSDTDRLPAFHLHFGGGGVAVTDDAGNRLDLGALAARAKAAMDQRLSDGERQGSQDEGSQAQGQTIDDVDYSRL